MPRWAVRVHTWVVVYFGMIVLFAAVFIALPGSEFTVALTPLDALYFSIITITTVGYGDIVPRGSIARVCVGLEALGGVTVVGLFLNALWREFTVRMEADQEDRDHRVHLIQSIDTLDSLWQYIETVLVEYEICTVELTTPIIHRADGCRYRPDFQFSDMQDVLGPSMRLRVGIEQSVLDRYFTIEDRIMQELKYLLANIGLVNFTELRNLVIGLLALATAVDVRDAALTLAKNSRENPYFSAIMHDAIARQGLRKDFREITAGPMKAMALLEQGVRAKMLMVERLKTEVKRLLAERRRIASPSSVNLAAGRKAPQEIPSQG